MTNSVQLRVSDMHCQACEQRLQAALARLDGVAAVDADHATGRVRLRFDPSRTSPDVLAPAAAERIAQAGFTVADRQESTP